MAHEPMVDRYSDRLNMLRSRHDDLSLLVGALADRLSGLERRLGIGDLSKLLEVFSAIYPDLTEDERRHIAEGFQLLLLDELAKLVEKP